MAEQHISLPKPFSGGDVADWFQRFKICLKASGQDAAVKAGKLPTLLWLFGWSSWQSSKTAMLSRRRRYSLRRCLWNSYVSPKEVAPRGSNIGIRS